jgi:predicted Zn-dependent protease
MSLFSRLLSPFRKAPAAAPLANFHAIFSEAVPQPAKLPEQHEAAPADPIAAALHGASIDPIARAEALHDWAACTLEQPDAQLAIQALLIRLGTLRMLPARQAVATAAMATFPNEPWPYAQAAAATRAAGNRQAAYAIARPAAERFPLDMDVARALVKSLRAATDHADAHYACIALSTGPLGPELNKQDWFLRQAILVAGRAEDHENALAWSASLRAIQPATPLAYTAAVAALQALGRPQEAISLAKEGLDACPNSSALVQEAALAAEAAGENDAAYGYWTRLRKLRSRNAAGFAGAARLSVKLKQPDITEALLRDGLKVFPADRELLLIAARDAITRLDWDQAAGYWDRLIARSADKPALAVTAATSLIGPAKGRNQRLPTVFARLEAICAAYPDFVPAAIAYLQTLRQAGRLEDAERQGKALAQRFPNDHKLAIARARVAELQKRPAEALALLQSVKAATPPSAALEAACNRLQRAADTLGEAEAV